MRIWRKGERAHIQCGEVHTTATVMIASANGRSLMLSFDAMLNGYVGIMPVFADDADTFRDLITGTPVYLSEIQ